MARFISLLSVALITFVVGLGASALVNQLGYGHISNSVSNLASTHRWQRRGPAMPWCDQRRTIVVGVDNDRRVYLGRVQVGSLDDASFLRDRLSKTLAWQERRLYGAESASDPSIGKKIKQTVYVEAPPSISFMELGRLLDAIKETGADRIEIITDSFKAD